MTDVLPPGWTEVALSDVCRSVAQRGPSSAETEFRYIDLGAIDNKTKRVVDPSTLATASAPSRAKQVVAGGDVLFSTVRVYLENIALIPSELGGAIASTAFTVLRPTLAVEPGYLYRLVTAKPFIQAVNALQRGNSPPSVQDGDVRSQRVPLPPLREQQRIVSRIEELFSEIDEGERALERVGRLVERYRQSVLKAAVTGELTREWRIRRRVAPYASDSQTEDLPAGWTQRIGKDLFKWASGDFLPGKNMIPGPIPVFGGNGVNGSHCEPNVSEATIVIGRVGVHCGNVHITSGSAWITDNAIYARRWPAEHNLKFLALVLRDARLGMLSQGGAQPFVNQKVLNETVFRLPPRAEQDRLVDAFEVESARLESVEATLVQQRHSSAALRQSILKAAFTGQLVPQDPRDEPASALLARLAAQASDAPATPRRRGRPAGRRSSQPNPSVAP